MAAALAHDSLVELISRVCEVTQEMKNTIDAAIASTRIPNYPWRECQRMMEEANEKLNTFIRTLRALQHENISDEGDIKPFINTILSRAAMVRATLTRQDMEADTSTPAALQAAEEDPAGYVQTIRSTYIGALHNISEMTAACDDIKEKLRMPPEINAEVRGGRKRKRRTQRKHRHRHRTRNHKRTHRKR